MNYPDEVLAIAVHRVTALPDALDKDELEAKAFKGSHMATTGWFVHTGMARHSPGIGLVYDPDLARRLLNEAGYPDGKGFPEIDSLHPTAYEDERIFPYLRSSWRENLGLGDDRFVILRDDIVDHSDYNVIIPVDAEDDAGLEEAVSVIGEQLEARNVSIVKVVEDGHIPWPPHAAHGFITEREVEALPIEQIPIKAGRQHVSPGTNKWG